MARMRWCSRCHHAFSDDQMETAPDEAGLPQCPFCRAPAAHLLVWDLFRDLHGHWPRQPEPGAVYSP